MVVLPCRDTFTSLKEFQVQMYMSTSVQYEEEKRALDLWSSVQHKCAIYQVGSLEQPVLGVRFEWFPTLSSRRERSTYRLPNGLGTKIVFNIGNITYRLSGFQIADAPGLPPSDAFFVITTHQASFFNSWCNQPTSSSLVTFHARFFPRCPKFTRNSQMATIQQLALPENERWHRLLLNQDDALQHVDLTAGADSETRDKAVSFAAISKLPRQLAQLQLAMASRCVSEILANLDLFFRTSGSTTGLTGIRSRSRR